MEDTMEYTIMLDVFGDVKVYITKNKPKVISNLVTAQLNNGQYLMADQSRVVIFARETKEEEESN